MTRDEWMPPVGPVRYEPPIRTRPVPLGRPRRRHRFLRKLLITVIILALLVVGGWFGLDYSLTRAPVLQDYPGRPAQGAGANWLVVGSDSVTGLTTVQDAQFAVGNASDTATGTRADSVMLLHIPDNDTKPTLVSLLRDSYLDIPGHGMNRLTAAYTLGGPALLARTVELGTHLRIDHFLAIGFGGLVNVVNDIGGVHLCLPAPITDPKAGLNLPVGCQTLDGGAVLGYARTVPGPQGDLARVVRQRQLLSALLDRVADPGVYANPIRLVPLLYDVRRVVTIDHGDHLLDLVRLAMTMRGAPSGGVVDTTVPVGGMPGVPGVGTVVTWDMNKASLLFGDLRTDDPVPSSVLSGTPQQAAVPTGP